MMRLVEVRPHRSPSSSEGGVLGFKKNKDGDESQIYITSIIPTTVWLDTETINLAKIFLIGLGALTLTQLFGELKKHDILKHLSL